MTDTPYFAVLHRWAAHAAATWAAGASVQIEQSPHPDGAIGITILSEWIDANVRLWPTGNLDLSFAPAGADAPTEHHHEVDGVDALTRTLAHIEALLRSHAPPHA